MRLLQLEGGPTPHIVADILFVDQKLVDGSTSSWSSEVCHEATGVQHLGDLAFRTVLGDKATVDFPDDLDFAFGSRR